MTDCEFIQWVIGMVDAIIEADQPGSSRLRGTLVNRALEDIDFPRLRRVMEWAGDDSGFWTMGGFDEVLEGSKDRSGYLSLLSLLVESRDKLHRALRHLPEQDQEDSVISELAQTPTVWSRPMTVKELASIFGVSQKTMGRHLKDGRYRHQRINRQSFRIDVHELPPDLT